MCLLSLLNGSLSPLANRVGQYFTWVILAISVATAAYWYGQDSSMIVKAVTSVLIVACPCALALSIPFTFGHAQRLLGKHGLYLKNTETLERLASIDHIVFDKTGTITQAQPSEIPFVGEPLSTEEQSWVRTIARTSTHPLSQAIYRSLPDHLPLLPITHFHEQAGQGITAKVEGVEIRIGSAAWVGNSSQTDTNVTQVYVRIGDQIRGYYRFANHYRPGFTSLMQQLRQGTLPTYCRAIRIGSELIWLHIFRSYTSSNRQ